MENARTGKKNDRFKNKQEEDSSTAGNGEKYTFLFSFLNNKIKNNSKNGNKALHFSLLTLPDQTSPFTGEAAAASSILFTLA